MRPFLGGPENRLVPIAATAVLDRGDCYNPLVFYGPTGSGKSHLARGLAREWKRRRAADRVVYLSGTEFARQYADALETHTLHQFRTLHRTARLLVLDELKTLESKPAAQQEFASALDCLLEQDGQIVVTLTTPPRALPKLLPRLASRLSGGLTVGLSYPGYAARLAILRELADLRCLLMPDAVAELFARELAVSVPALSRAVTELHALAEHDGAAIDVDFGQRCLQRLVHPTQPTLRGITSATAKTFSLCAAQLQGKSRRRTISLARGIAMYLARQWTDKSLGRIGKHFGGRDHTTVLHNCRVAEARLRTDPNVSHAVRELAASLGFDNFESWPPLVADQRGKTVAAASARVH